MNHERHPRVFEGAVVAITGASSGVGASLAAALARGGANPVLFARSHQALEEVAARCREAGSEPLVVPGDVMQLDDCARMVEQASDRFGRLDVLVGCAGLSMWARFDELSDLTVLRRVMEVNYWGLVQPAHCALPQLKASRGLLVAISSVQGKFGVPWHSGYAASKHAVQGFCDSLRLELRDSGVDVLTVLAHWIQGTNLRHRALAGDGQPKGERAADHGRSAVPLEQVTERIMTAMAKRRRTVFIPRWMRGLCWLSQLTPSAVDRLILRRVRREALHR